MPTPEEIAAEKAAKDVADKKAADDAAKAEAEKKSRDFDSWLATQPDNVKALYEEKVGGLKSALDKEREAAKDAKASKEKLAKFEKEAEEKRLADMTETERLKAEKAKAEEKATALELKDMQRTAADKIGLPAEFADRLKGKTPEEMEADAQKLLEAMPKQEKKQQKKIDNNAPSGEGKDASEMTDAEKSSFLFGR